VSQHLTTPIATHPESGGHCNKWHSLCFTQDF